MTTKLLDTLTKKATIPRKKNKAISDKPGTVETQKTLTQEEQLYEVFEDYEEFYGPDAYRDDWHPLGQIGNR